MNYNDNKKSIKNKTLTINDSKEEYVSTNHPKMSDELLDALKETDQIIEDIKSGKRKGYHNIDKLFEDLENELRD